MDEASKIFIQSTLPAKGREAIPIVSHVAQADQLSFS